MEQVFASGDAPAVVVQRDASGVIGGAEAQLSASDAELYARFFRVLSDPTRVRLLHLQPYREGKYVYYRIADPRVRELLVVGGAMMRDHAAGIASCGVIH